MRKWQSFLLTPLFTIGGISSGGLRTTNKIADEQTVN